jgi:hypothetical protein
MGERSSELPLMGLMRSVSQQESWSGVHLGKTNLRDSKVFWESLLQRLIRS